MRNWRTLTQAEIDKLGKLYPVMPNRDLAVMFDISKDAIVKHFVKSFGWKKDLRAVFAYDKKYHKKALSDDEIEWFKENFPINSNAYIIEHLHISEASFRRYVKMLGLKKSPEFIDYMKREARKEGINVCKAYNLYDGRAEFMRKQWAKAKAGGKSFGKPFVKGENNYQRYGEVKGKEIMEKIHQSLRNTRKKEIRRVKFGLEQKTNMRIVLNPLSHTATSHKHRMIKFLNYFADKEHSSWVCYDEETKRSVKSEETARKHGLKIIEVV